MIWNYEAESGDLDNDITVYFINGMRYYSHFTHFAALDHFTAILLLIFLIL